MNVFQAIETRQSIRSFQDRNIEEDKLTQILNAARLAPSAKNRQEWRFIVVRDEGTRQKLAEAAKGQKFVGEAPVVIACCALESEYRMTCGHPAYAIDLAIAIDHMTLAAIELGIGSCWIGAFYQDQAKRILNVPDSVTVVELLVLGYPAHKSIRKARKSIEEIVAFEKW